MERERETERDRRHSAMREQKEQDMRDKGRSRKITEIGRRQKRQGQRMSTARFGDSHKEAVSFLVFVSLMLPVRDQIERGRGYRAQKRDRDRDGDK